MLNLENFARGKQYTPSMVYVVGAAIVTRIAIQTSHKSINEIPAYWIVRSSENNFALKQVYEEKNPREVMENDLYQDLGVLFQHMGQWCLLAYPMLDSDTHRTSAKTPKEFIESYQQFLQEHPDKKPTTVLFPIAQHAENKRHFVFLVAQINSLKNTITFEQYDSLPGWRSWFYKQGSERLRQLTERLTQMFQASTSPTSRKAAVFAPSPVISRNVNVQQIIDTTNCGSYILCMIDEFLRGEKVEETLQKYTYDTMTSQIRPLHHQLYQDMITLSRPESTLQIAEEHDGFLVLK